MDSFGALLTHLRVGSTMNLAALLRNVRLRLT